MRCSNARPLAVRRYFWLGLWWCPRGCLQFSRISPLSRCASCSSPFGRGVGVRPEDCCDPRSDGSQNELQTRPKMYADKRRANKKQRRHGIFEVWKLKIPFAVPVAVGRI